MGLFDDIGDVFGEITGLGGSGNPNTHQLNPDAYAHLYNEAIGGIEAAGKDPALMGLRDKSLSSANSLLADLENNAAGRKANFMEDMARGFQADMTSRARAAGGTGNMAQALSAPGGFYDSQARATSRGLNDLYGQAVDDLGQLGGVQQQYYNQDMNKAITLGNMKNAERSGRLGIAANNQELIRGSEAAGAARRAGTINQLKDNVIKGMTMGTGGF